MVSFGAGAAPSPGHGWGFPRAHVETVFSQTSGPRGPRGPQRRGGQSRCQRPQLWWGPERERGGGFQGQPTAFLTPPKFLSILLGKFLFNPENSNGHLCCSCSPQAGLGVCDNYAAFPLPEGQG